MSRLDTRSAPRPLLQTSGLTVRYGGVVAVDGIDITVHAGTVVGLIGPNGAGKTSFIDGLTGYTPAGGGIVFAGRDLSAAPAHRRVRAGLVRTWQSVELFEDLTVRENLQVAAEEESTFDLLVDLVRPRGRAILKGQPAVDSALADLGITSLAERYPTDLSQGERKLVGVARAVASRPRLLCLDEPAAGLDTDESLALGRRLRQLVTADNAVLLVDHDMGLVFDVCDVIYVINFGRLLAQGPAAQVRSNPAVVEAYLGSRADAPQQRTTTTTTTSGV